MRRQKGPDPLEDLFGKDPLADLFPEVEEEKKGILDVVGGGYGAMSDLGKGIVKGAKKGLGDLASIIGGLSSPAQTITNAAQRMNQVEDPSNSTFESVGRLGGEMVASLPLYAGIGTGIGTVGKVAGASVKNPILKAALSAAPTMTENSTRAGTIAKTVAAGIPQEVVTGLVGTLATNPKDLDSAKKLAVNVGLGAASSVVRGIKAGKDFDLLKEVRDDLNRVTSLPELNKVEQKIIDNKVGAEGLVPAIVKKYREITNHPTPDIQGNPVRTDLELPGSGVQSVKPYIPESIPTDPLAVPNTSKFEKQPTGVLDENVQAVAKHIDFDNKHTQAARDEKTYLLNTPIKRAAFAFLDHNQPILEASERAYDMAGKMARIGVRQDIAIRDRLSIPQVDGTYRDGAESVVPMLRALEANPEKVQALGILMHAEQKVAGEAASAPFSMDEAVLAVEKIREQFPDVAKVYEERYLPIADDMVNMMEAYSNLPISAKAIGEMRERLAYASLARANFGESNISGSLKGRQDKASGLLIGDPISNLQDNIRSLVRYGEKTNMLGELVEATRTRPELLEHIEFVPYQKRPEVEEIIQHLSDDIPLEARRAYAEVMLAPKADSRSYNIKYNGQLGTVRISEELNNALEFSNFQKSMRPENATPIENIGYGIGTGLQKTEKAAGLLYSYYRDIFGAAPIYDYIDAKMNLGELGDVWRRPWTVITEPAKGFMAGYKNIPEVQQLKIAGAGTGHRGRFPGDDDITRKTSDLLDLARRDPTNYKVVNGNNLFVGLADNLANATRVAVSLQKLKTGASIPETASLYNNVIGDPYRMGALVAAFGRMTNFFNFPLQANTATVKSFLSGGEKQAGKTGADLSKMALHAARGLTQLGLPTAAIWYLQKDNEKLREARQDPNSKTYTFIQNPWDENEVFAVRKHYLYGSVFQTGIEQMLDELYAKGDTEAIEQIGGAVLRELVPNVMPFTANAILPLYTGQRVDPFTGAQSVVPGGRQGMLPEDQIDPANASQASKSISSVTGIPAGIVENIFRTFLIGPTYNAYQLADDYAFGEKNSKPKTFNGYTFLPGVRKLEVPKIGIKQVQDFYEVMSEAQSVLKSIESASNHGQISRFLELQTKYQDKIPKYQMIVDYKSDMDQISQDILDVKLNEMWSPEQKRQEIDRLVALRIVTAKGAMERYKQFD